MLEDTDSKTEKETIDSTSAVWEAAMEVTSTIERLANELQVEPYVLTKAFELLIKLWREGSPNKEGPRTHPS